MKTIKQLTVKCTYTVGLGNVEVPDDVYSQLEDGGQYSSDDRRNYEALKWLEDNVKEDDAWDWEYDVDIW